MPDDQRLQTMDSFLLSYTADELRNASEVLSNWMPYLTRGLCKSCKRTISDSIRSLRTERDAVVSSPTKRQCAEVFGSCNAHSIGRIKDSPDADDADTHSVVSWKDEPGRSSENAAGSLSPRLKKSWADMAMEEELSAEEEQSNEHVDANDAKSRPSYVEAKPKPKVALSRDQREDIRFRSVERKKDFKFVERVCGRSVNILDGLELHKGIFSAAEQKRIVSYVEELREMGRNGKLKERTYSAPQKWMRGKGRVTLQFGCCYNYALDKKGNPPGILKAEVVDPLPHLFKVMIKRLIRWHVLPPSCVPDSCIVNIYEEGDCIPPHIDNHEFVRPFCTVSFLSECNILFGSNLRIKGAGEFEGSYAIPLPLGSVLVLNGNGADVAKHCVPAVPSKRISITFRRMDESRRPIGYTPEPDLQGLQPLPDGEDRSSKYTSSEPKPFLGRHTIGGEDTTKEGKGEDTTKEGRHPRYAPSGRRFELNSGYR